ncbi:MAG: hypothetical protein ACI9FN_004074 [Saprospiraceae bacterium]
MESKDTGVPCLSLETIYASVEASALRLIPLNEKT